MPLQRYVATVTLKPVTDGDRTFWHWESSFATPPGRERELREMVARDVYEAGFANLRRHLQRGGRLCARRAARRCPRVAAAGAAHRAARLRRHRAARRARRRSAAAGPGEVRIRQRAIGVNFIDVYLAPRLDASRCCSPAAHRAWRLPAACSTSALVSPACCQAIAWRRIGPVPGAYAQRAHGAGRLGGAAASRRWRTRLRPRCCSRPHRALPVARPRAASRAARGCWCTQPPAAWACCVRLGTALGATVVGTVSSEAKARARARARLRARDRHRATTVLPMRCRPPAAAPTW